MAEKICVTCATVMPEGVIFGMYDKLGRVYDNSRGWLQATRILEGAGAGWTWVDSVATDAWYCPGHDPGFVPR